METRNRFLTSIVVLFGWVPSLILMPLAILGLFAGALTLFSGSFTVSLSLFLLGLLGILGFVGMTSVCWGVDMSLNKRTGFLLCGVIALTVVSAWFFYPSFDSSSLQSSPKLYLFYYLFIAPLLVAITLLIEHVKSRENH